MVSIGSLSWLSTFNEQLKKANIAIWKYLIPFHYSSCSQTIFLLSLDLTRLVSLARKRQPKEKLSHNEQCRLLPANNYITSNISRIAPFTSLNAAQSVCSLSRSLASSTIRWTMPRCGLCPVRPISLTFHHFNIY
jgi:hypothetical protein